MGWVSSLVLFTVYWPLFALMMELEWSDGWRDMVYERYPRFASASLLRYMLLFST